MQRPSYFIRISFGSAQGHDDLMGRAVGEHRQDVALDGSAVHRHDLHAAADLVGVVDGDRVGRAAESDTNQPLRSTA